MVRFLRSLFVVASLLLAWTLSQGTPSLSVSKSPTKTPAPSPSPPPSACDVTVPLPVLGSNTSLIESAEAATPDGGTLCFPDATYRSDQTWTIADRFDLTVVGNGAELVATSLVGDQDPGPRVDGRAHVVIQDGSGVSISDLHVRSANTSCVHQPAFELEHGFAILGSENAHLDGVTVHAVGGDGVALAEHNDFPGSVTERTRNARIEGSSFTCLGRQGLSVTDADGFEVAHSIFDDIARTAVDFEPIRNSAIVENGSIHDSTFTDFANYWAGGSGRAGNIQRNIVFEFNTATRLTTKLGTPDGVIDRLDWVFRGNVGLLPIPEDGGPQRSAFVFLEAARILVEGNVQAFGPEDDTVGVEAIASTRVSVIGNDFAGVDVVCRGC